MASLPALSNSFVATIENVKTVSDNVTYIFVNKSGMKEDAIFVLHLSVTHEIKFA